MQHVTCHGSDRRGRSGLRQALAWFLCATLVGCVHDAAARGRRALDDGAFSVAALELEKAVRARPDDVSYWVDLGRAHIGLGDGPAAVEAFAAACKVAPTSERLWVFLGHAHEMSRDYDQATAAYERATVVAPHRAWPWRVLGARLLRWGRPQQAVEALQAALALDAAHAETHNALATALAEVGDLGAAQALLEQAVVQFPQQRRLWLGLAAVHVKRGHLRAALDVYTQVQQRWPAFAPVHAGRALLLLQLGRRRQAVQAMQSAVSLAPQRSDYRDQLLRMREGAR